jgi:nucleotide-binding universal stress UspA family protein
VGSSGWAGAGYWSQGAFAAATARATGRPTLTIPEGHVLRGGGADVPFRRIVSAVDFTHASVRAAHEALALAQQGAGHVTLLHVLDAFPCGPARVGALARIGEYAAHVDRLNRELARLASPEALHWCEIETQTAAGAVHDTVASVAAAQRADLVVLGVTIRSRLARLVSGSTVDRVLRRASRPVLIVPGPAGLAAVLGDRRLVVGGTERAI